MRREAERRETTPSKRLTRGAPPAFGDDGHGEEPASYRILSPSENAKAAFTRTARRYVPGNITRITKAIKTISYRRFINPTKGASPEQIAREHLHGVRMYLTHARREQAAKTRAAAELKRVVKKIDRLNVVRNMSPNERKGGGKTWHLLPDVPAQFLEDRVAKLRGEEILVGRWHSMMDVAKAIDDPALNRLMTSPAVLPKDIKEAA